MSLSFQANHSWAFEGRHSTVVSQYQHYYDMLRGVVFKDVFQTTGLPIVWEMHDEFFPDNKLTMN